MPAGFYDIERRLEAGQTKPLNTRSGCHGRPDKPRSRSKLRSLI
jgi:hypothetical protein